MSDNGCQSCEIPVKACERSRAIRAEACCTDCAPNAPWVLHLQMSADQTLRVDLAAISEWCRGIARKADAQGNDALAVTAPRVAEEIDRALTGAPLAYARYTPVEGTEEALKWLRANGKLP